MKPGRPRRGARQGAGRSPPVNGPFPDVAFTWINSKDLFRYSATSAAQGVSDWRADTRDKFFSLTGASVDDSFPVEVTGITWQCVASPGASCTASGSGAIHDTVDLPAGATVTYTATGTAAGIGTNAATVTPPSGVQDDSPGNNSSG